MASLAPEYSTRTEAGRVRQVNADRVYAGPLFLHLTRHAAPQRHLLMIADGVGGLPRGDWASERAVAVVTAELPVLVADQEPREALRSAIQAANAQIWAAKGEVGAATTIVAVIIGEDRLWWAHVGDSRAYLVSEDNMLRLTRDHSWVEELVRSGSMTPEQARLSERRNAITRSLGFQPDVEVDTGGPVDLRQGNSVVLCSDGVHGVLTDEEIASVARTCAPGEATQQLVALSNERGGTDNISVIVCRLVDIMPAT